MALSRPAGTPRKLICVPGEASRLPASGETVTAPPWSAELFNVAGVHCGPEAAAARWDAKANHNPRASAGPRMRARMDSIDRKQNKRVDRRTFLKGGLAVGGVLGAGLAIRAAADTTSGSPPASSPSPAPASPPRRPGGRP